MLVKLAAATTTIIDLQPILTVVDFVDYQFKQPHNQSKWEM